MKRINIQDIDFSKPRVRYQGEVQDKCDLSFLINEVALMAGNGDWPLHSDIYWHSSKYSELKETLIGWINKYNEKQESK